MPQLKEKGGDLNGDNASPDFSATRFAEGEVAPFAVNSDDASAENSKENDCEGAKNGGSHFYDKSALRADLFAAGLCLLAAFIFVTIVSKSSFLYPFHDGNDVNWFLTMGRGIANGKVPYKDLFEQKGVFLYMLFALNYVICGNQLYVIYAIEIICGAAYLFLSYKIMRLYLSYRASLAGTLVVGVVVYTCRAFWCGAGEAEEYCLPFFAYGVYVFLRSAASGETVPYIRAAICGLFAGCIFWIKFSMLAFYLALAVCVFVDAAINKKIKEGFICAGAFIGAFALFSVPWLIYLGVNGALGDMWRVYIVFNIFGYASDGNFLSGINDFFSALMGVPRNFFLYALVIFGVVFLYIRAGVQKRYKIYYTVIVAFTFVVQCLIMGNIGYYHLAMAAFAPLGIAGLGLCLGGLIAAVIALFNSRRCPSQKYKQRFFSVYDSAVEKKDKFFAVLSSKAGEGVKAKAVVPAFVAAAILSLIFGNNSLELLNSRAYYPQFTAAEIIANCGKDDPSLLCYKMFDRGFYTVCDETPEFYYFAQNLVSRESYPELYDSQESYVKNGEPDFVITERSYWDEERGAGRPLHKYEFVVGLEYKYIRSNFDRVNLDLCLLVLMPDYGGRGAERCLLSAE